MLRVGVTTQAPEIARGQGRLTHWRTLMKPSGSSRRRQRSPTSRRSTCRETEPAVWSRRRARRESVGAPCAPPGGEAGRADSDSSRTPGWTGAGEGPRALGAYLWARRLVRRAAGALRRGHAGAAGRGAGVRLPGREAAGRAGALGAAGSRPWEGRAPGWRAGSWGRCCSRSRRLRPPRCHAGCRKPPSPIQTSVKLPGGLGSGVTWRAVANPAPAPCAPLFPRVRRLKGTCGACWPSGCQKAPGPCQKLPGRLPAETAQPPQRHRQGQEPTRDAWAPNASFPGFSGSVERFFYRDTHKLFLRPP